jgi:hypothetical protein
MGMGARITWRGDDVRRGRGDDEIDHTLFHSLLVSSSPYLIISPPTPSPAKIAQKSLITFSAISGDT